MLVFSLAGVKKCTGQIYVLDRGYAKYGLLREITNIKSSFVCRIRDNAIYKTTEEKDLSDKAVKEGIVFDKTVELGGETAEIKLKNIRIVAVKCNPKDVQKNYLSFWLVVASAGGVRNTHPTTSRAAFSSLPALSSLTPK